MKNYRRILNKATTCPFMKVGKENISKGIIIIRAEAYVLDGVDLEALVNEYAGTGQIRRDSRGEWINKQFFNHSRNIGVNINPETKTESLTSYFSIEYSKSKGVHIIPRKGGLK